MQVGDKSGFGRYGFLDGDNERIICHECGKLYKRLSAHVTMAHDMTVEDYKERHGIPRGTGLVSPALHRAISGRAKQRVGSEGWQRMVEKRDPVAASRARSAESFQRRGADIEAHKQTSRANIKGVRKPVTRRCKVCGGLIPPARKGVWSCSPLCSRILKYEAYTRANSAKWAELHDAGESWSAIGRLYGVSHVAVREGVKRYRRNAADREFLERFGPGELPEDRPETL